MFNRAKFKACAILAGKTLREVAEYIGISETTLYRKLARNGDFTREEIVAITDCLRLENPNEIFFAE